VVLDKCENGNVLLRFLDNAYKYLESENPNGSIYIQDRISTRHYY
jgi:phosphoribosylformylglycinamidine (FGAM) synthase-like amidotransferase family enzyme